MKNLWRHVSSGLLFIPNVRCNKIWARDQIVNIHWIKEKGREFQKKHLLLIIAYAKGFDCVDHNKLWKILKEKGILGRLICLLRSLYAGQEATGPYMKKLIGSKLGREYIKAVYCHLAYLTYIWVLCLVTQSCPPLCDPRDCSWPDSSVHRDSPGKNTGVGCHALLQRIFPTQGLNPSLPYCRQILYCLRHQGSPGILEWGAYPFSRGFFQPKDWTGSPEL